MSASTPPPPSPPSFDDVLVAALTRYELDGRPGVDAMLADHPEHRDAVHAHLERLCQLGLLTPWSPTAVGVATAVLANTGPFPERIGDFQLLRRLGGGGMGVVFLARQLSLGRAVALKLVRADHLLLPGTRERFRREVDTIARLQHPGIVPVFAAGEDQGIPWLAMEHVQGASLAEVLQQARDRDPATLRGSDLRAAVLAITAARGDGGAKPSGDLPPTFAGTWVSACLRVCRAVAHALQHAHERSVLHRDIKPSNVMLTPDGRALLLDFGLATAEDAVRLTGTGSQLGTPAYMSPEQMRGEWRTLDERSDVYSLGVTMYELLTLQPPFDGQSSLAIRDRVLGGQVRPLRQHNPAISRDVELVVRKAMDVDRAHRYGDVAAFAADLDNLLELRPIAASPPSAVRLVRRWAQRHPARAVAAVAGVLLSVVAPTVFLLQQQAAKAEIQAALAVAQEQQRLGCIARDAARVQRDLAREAVDTMLTRVAVEELLDVPRLQRVRADLLNSARAFYERFLAAGSDDPELLEQAARAALRVAFIEAELGHLTDSSRAASRAVELAQQLVARTPDAASAQALLANTWLSLARVQQQQVALAPALQSLAAAREHATAALRADPDDAGAATHLLGIERSTAMVLSQLGRPDEASAAWRALLALWQTHGRAAADDRHAEAALDHFICGTVDEAQRQLECSAADRARDTIEHLADLLEGEPTNHWSTVSRLALARLAGIRAGLAAADGDRAGQERELRACLQGADELLVANPDHANALRMRAMASNGLGMLLGDDPARKKEGVAMLELSLATLRALLTFDATPSDNRANLAATLVNLGAAHRRLGKVAAAAPLFREAVELAQFCHDAAPTRGDWTGYLFQALWFLGLAEGELGDHRAQVAAAKRLAALRPDDADTQAIAAELLATAATVVVHDEAMAAEVRERERSSLLQAAMAQLVRAAESGFGDLERLREAPEFAPLRALPEFAALLQRIEARAAGK